MNLLLPESDSIKRKPTKLMLLFFKIIMFITFACYFIGVFIAVRSIIKYNIPLIKNEKVPILFCFLSWVGIFLINVLEKEDKLIDDFLNK